MMVNYCSAAIKSTMRPPRAHLIERGVSMTALAFFLGFITAVSMDAHDSDAFDHFHQSHAIPCMPY